MKIINKKGIIKEGITTDNEKDNYLQQLNGIIDSFGYEWKRNRRTIELDLSARNYISFKYDKFIENLSNKLDMFSNKKANALLKKQKVKQEFESITTKYATKYATKYITHAKVSSIDNIFAVLVLLIIFSIILKEFYRISNILGLSLTLFAILGVIASLVGSVHDLFLTDEQYLHSKFRFSKKGNMLSTDVLNIVKKMEQGRVQYLMLAVTFISLSVIPFFYKNFAITFVDNDLNSAGLVIATISLLVRAGMSRVIKADQKAARNSFVAILMLITLALYILGLFSGYSLLKMGISRFFDVIVIYSIFTFARDINRTRRFYGWVDENLK